jgi:hypothetical protein
LNDDLDCSVETSRFEGVMFGLLLVGKEVLIVGNLWGFIQNSLDEIIFVNAL